METHTLSLGDQIARMHDAVHAQDRCAWIPPAIHALLIACLARIFGRLENLVRMWQDGQLPPLSQRTPPPPRPDLAPGLPPGRAAPHHLPSAPPRDPPPEIPPAPPRNTPRAPSRRRPNAGARQIPHRNIPPPLHLQAPPPALPARPAAAKSA